MTAVIYARYSSDNQREESIEGQIRECTAYAEKNGITIVKHYIDRTIPPIIPLELFEDVQEKIAKTRKPLPVERQRTTICSPPVWIVLLHHKRDSFW